MVRDFFDGYNRNIANRHKFELKVIYWEHHSNSGVGRPQTLITEQTLNEYRNSLVLVVGLLGQRFGTPTGDYESGTEEEFATAMRFRNEQHDWPEIKCFFRNSWAKQGAPDDPDKLIEAGSQWKKVKEFKNRLQTGEPPLYTVDFPTTDDFQIIFSQDIERWLNDPARPWQQANSLPAAQSNSETPPQKTPYLDIWFKLLAAECAHLPLEILDARQGMEQADPIGLPDIFVPLKAIAPSKAWYETTELDRSLARELATGDTSKSVPIMKLLNKQRLSVVIGDPGSGKSALVNQLTWLQLNPTKPLPARIPLRIILRRVQIPPDAKQGQASWIWAALEQDIKETLENHHRAGDQAKAVVTALQQNLLQAPYGLILLDGLDEVPSANQRRGLLLQAIQALVSALPDQTQFIVTARPYAYTDPRWRLKDFDAFFLTPFDQEQREQFVNGWYAAASKRFMLKNADLKQRIPDLIDRVEAQPHLRELAERPLLLTLISTLHASGGRLPEDRAELYKNSVELLLYHWRREPFRDSDGQALLLDDTELLKCLQTLAYQSHQAQREQQDARHTADIPQTAILAAFEPLLDKLGRDDLLAFLQQHTGILIAREQNSFAFPHRSFQEYLAMGHLTRQQQDALSPEVCADPLWWSEVFLLAVIEQQKNPRFACSYIRDMLECGKNLTDEHKNRLYVLSALALSELGLNGANELVVEVRQGLKNLIANPASLNIGERAEAGRALAAIGDDRVGVVANAKGLPDIKWLEIPHGVVNIEHKRIPVAAFSLAKYPITNAQFQCFIDDPEGYNHQRWWVGLAKQSDSPEASDWTEANHPRETVSWYEAMAFCAWLSKRLRLNITLPTEEQWLQAACGGRADYNYPWGKDYLSGYANINETYGDVGPHDLQRTTAVGLYPQGDSLQGVADLSGNVKEWCLKPGNTRLSEKLTSVACGGSWSFGRVNALASSRENYAPENRNGKLGFRVCYLSPSISS